MDLKRFADNRRTESAQRRRRNPTHPFAAGPPRCEWLPGQSRRQSDRWRFFDDSRGVGWPKGNPGNRQPASVRASANGKVTS